MRPSAKVVRPHLFLIVKVRDVERAGCMWRHGEGRGSDVAADMMCSCGEQDRIRMATC